MRRLVEDLLSYASAGREEVSQVTVVLQAVMQHVADLTAELAEQQGAVLTWDDLPPTMGNEILLGQVFTNLVTNALKHGGPGVQVHVGWEPGEEEDVIYVRDTGPGIPADQLERIWKPFRRLGRRTGDEGSGLGLAIVRRVIQRHGGRTWAESAPGQGTTFRLTLMVIPGAV